MDVHLRTGQLQDIDVEALIILAFEKAPAGQLAAGGVDLAKELYDSGEFSGKACDWVLLHRPAGLAAKRVLLLGVGKAEKFDAAEMRKAASLAVRTLKGKKIKGVALALPPEFSGPEFAAAAVEGAVLATFEPNHYKTIDKEGDKPVETFSLVVADEAKLQQAVEAGRIMGEAQNYARELANMPGNLLPPLALADHARRMCGEMGLDCEVLEQEQMRQLGMGALLGVAQGSAEPPALIIMRYKPSQAGPSGVNLGLVGKGVTFDTGGISIKPAEGMEKMKYDMCGAAAVLGAMRAIARLKPPIPVTGIIPTVENMPGSKAQRPGDIVTSLSGKTVEVLNTDAEGRLILIDAITYAEKQGCTHLIDAATLTGAIVVALGHVHVGAFSNNDEFLKRVLAAAGKQGEKMWPMPLDAEYREGLKSPFADIQNIGPRWGGAITAAKFIEEFVGESTPWVHLDIAGTAWLDENKPWMPKGPTGIGVRTFVEVAMGWTQQ